MFKKGSRIHEDKIVFDLLCEAGGIKVDMIKVFMLLVFFCTYLLSYKCDLNPLTNNYNNSNRRRI